MVENKEQDDENKLVEELSPALHQKSTGDLPATMKSVVLGGYFSRSNSVLHTSGGCHGILTSNTNAIEEESPDVADDPAVLGYAPGGGKHDETKEHDDSVLDKTPTTA